MIFIDLIDAISGILKRRKVANMLCAEYSYKMDIAVKEEEAAEDKAEEIATKMLSKEYPTTEISEMTGLTLEQILELQKKITVQAQS